MEQYSVLLGDKILPVIKEDGVQWFPITYVFMKVLERKGKPILKCPVRKYMISYEETNGGVQETNCISREDLINTLNKTKVGWLSVERRIAQNKLHKYLGLDLFPVDEQDTKEFNKNWLKEYDEFTKEIVQMEVDTVSDLEYRRCSKCEKHYPLTNRFYSLDDRASKGFLKLCKICAGIRVTFRHYDEDKEKLIKKDKNLYEDFVANNVSSVYEAYYNGKLNKLPKAYRNKDSYKEILLHLYNSGKINENNLTSKYLIKELKLKSLYSYFSIHEVYSLIFGDDFFLYKWKYPKYTFSEVKLTFDIATRIMNNYICEHNVEISDPLTFNYLDVLNACNLVGYINGNLLDFIVEYNSFKYPGYKYKVASVNYYKKEQNLLFDLKYLIEDDLSIDQSKIPLYLTRMTFQRQCRPLYNFIITNKNGSIYEWVNKLYPDKFTAMDFEVNAYREEFDSNIECFIHEHLKETFGNVVYNQKHTDKTIKIDGMIPDWFVFTDHGVYIVEYFGMYEQRQMQNDRIKSYIVKTHKKIEKYQKVRGYKFLLLYPDDIVNDYFGYREKVQKVLENPDFTMI